MKMIPLKDTAIWKEYVREFNSGQTDELNFTKWWGQYGNDWFEVSQRFEKANQEKSK